MTPEICKRFGSAVLGVYVVWGTRRRGISRGTACCASNGPIITAASIILDENSHITVFNDKLGNYPVTVVKKDPVHDLAVLRLAKSDSTAALTTFPIASEPSLLGKQAFIVAWHRAGLLWTKAVLYGSPEHAVQNIREKRVARPSPETAMLRFSQVNTLYPFDWIGSPIFDEDGHLLSIVSKREGRGQDSNIQENSDILGPATHHLQAVISRSNFNSS